MSLDPHTASGKIYDTLSGFKAQNPSERLRQVVGVFIGVDTYQVGTQQAAQNFFALGHHTHHF